VRAAAGLPPVRPVHELMKVRKMPIAELPIVPKQSNEFIPTFRISYSFRAG
jgi:hypothetical protein